MAIITLTSDWGTRDYYAAAVKGSILQLLPGVNIVDISHGIPPFNLHHASFVVRNSYRHFPEESIHIIDMNSDTPAKTKYLLVESEKQFFIAPDNGIFSLIFDKSPDKIIEISVPPSLKTSTFIAKDLFAPIACNLAQGAEPEAFGVKVEGLSQRVSFAPTVDGNVIRGKVVYIDSYENAFLNINQELFHKVGQGRPFTIYFKTLDNAVQKISQSYNDVPEGDILAVFSSCGLLEIAINKGNASGLLGLKTDEMVRIEFRD
ncbi:MAG: S-adenosyl-l-methionine hydroxide adenosyltransferase family protein [Bacteroidales bacterium]